MLSSGLCMPDIGRMIEKNERIWSREPHLLRLLDSMPSFNRSIASTSEPFATKCRGFTMQVVVIITIILIWGLFKYSVAVPMIFPHCVWLFIPFLFIISVAKPLVVDGTAKSHELCLAYDQLSLSELEPPLVLQEFVNHGTLLWPRHKNHSYCQCTAFEIYYSLVLCQGVFSLRFLLLVKP